MKDNLLPAEARTRVTEDERITGVILAGGQGRRMGTIDKGLVSIDGRPMVAHVLGRLRPQVDEILINANQHRVEYEAFGYPVLADAIGGFAGPLAGLHVALTHASFARVATVPCDSPFLPEDLIAADCMQTSQCLREASCADAYDRTSLPVGKARELIASFLVPVTAVERVHVRNALGRVLAEDIVSPIAVPGHDNSAMDGYALRFADLKADGETVLKRIGESFAGMPWNGAIGAGECVRIFTGGVMPQGADTVVMQERASEDAAGVRIAPGAVRKAGTNRRFAGEDLKQGQIVFRAGQR